MPPSPPLNPPLHFMKALGCSFQSFGQLYMCCLTEYLAEVSICSRKKNDVVGQINE